MSILQVPGAELHYDLVGDGPLIVFIAGAQGSAAVFQPIAEALKDRFTVLTYDRRGFSRCSFWAAWALSPASAVRRSCGC